MSNPKLIAMYLPQFHTTPNNDIWWGKGFTEWTNCARAKPLFRGHKQPHVPGELGFYNLKMEETRQAQAELAKEYGIYGFCYYYRFENGKNELDFPIKEVLRLKRPDFPFMICWANQSWHKKFWRYDGTSEDVLLAEQKYNGEQDYKDFFYECLPFFLDERYIKIHNKPAFMIHKPKDFKDIHNFMIIWQELARKESLDGIYFIGYSNTNLSNAKLQDKIFLKKTINAEEDYRNIIDLGFDAVTINRQYVCRWGRSIFKRAISKIKRDLFKRPFIISYSEAIKTMIGEETKISNVYPTILPNWDHTPRSGCGGEVFLNSSPKLFYNLLIQTYELIKNKDDEDKVVFIKAWNEWGEGNYLEPDLEWHRGYLEAIKDSLNMDNTAPLKNSDDLPQKSRGGVVCKLSSAIKNMRRTA